jgi:prefoldin subunit 5
MNREEAITTLEQHIARLETALADLQKDCQSMQDAVEGTNELLQRVKAGDEAAIREVSDLLEMGVERVLDPLD